MQTEGGVLDTFDEGSYSGDDGVDDSAQDGMEEVPNYESMESFDEDEDPSSEEDAVQAKEGEEIDPDSQVNLLEDQEEKGAPKTEKKPDSKDEKSEKDDEDADTAAPKDDAPDDVGEDAADVRNLKAFREGKAYEVPEDAEVSVKINGKTEKVALKDLRDSYSGKVAYDEKFSTMDTERKSFESQKETYEAEIDEVRNEMSGIRDLVVKAQNGEAHPIAGFKQLLDLMGVNSVHYEKQMMEQLYDEYDIFSEMSDSEREAHWLQKENKYLVDKQESEISKSSASKAQAEQRNYINSVREAQNVSEDDFYSAYDDLLDQGLENITPELVAQTAKLNPLMDIGEEVMSRYADQLSTDEMSNMVREVAITLYENPEYTVDDIKSWIAEDLEVETLVSEVNSKQRAPAPLKVPKSNRMPDSGYESFDDWE